jgi:hypothetical protein
MKRPKTRKAKKQKGGDPPPTDILRVLSSYDLIVDRPNQIKHCLCQLKRFAPDFFHNKPIREYQFFLNLGRLQELVGDTTHPEIWWRPIKQILEIAHSEKSENQDADTSIYIERIKTFVSDLESLFDIQITNAEIARGCEYK